MTELVIRPLDAGEEHLFLSLADPALVGVASTGRDFAQTLALRQYRPEWTWIALRGDRVVARAAWWGGPKDAEPVALDWFDFGRDAQAGTALLRAAPFRAEYCLILPPAWRRDPAVEAEAGMRVAAAEQAGMRRLVERIRYLWTPSDGLPERPARLEYRPCPQDEDVLDVIRRFHVGTLDAHVIEQTARAGAEAAAQEELKILNWFPAPREWWRLAYTQEGELVGLTVPSRNHTSPVIGIIGVLPEQRGRGYGYDLLAEATHLLAAEGAHQIAADTDVTNTPMVAAFARAGYPIVQQRIFMKW
jgi:GNAT superfamily N-acetyltransferase